MVAQAVPGRDGAHLMKRQCYWVDNDSFDEDKNAYIPSLVTEDEPGHRLFSGGLDETPYYWGKTLDEARAVCAQVNKDLFGLSEEDTREIIRSSMKAGPVPPWMGGIEGS